MPKNAPGRNDPCPCGSEKKYKHCHLGKNAEEIEETAKRNVLAMVLVAICIVAGVAVGFAYDLKTGFAVGAGSLMLVGLYFVIQKPPPPNSDSGDPAGLNFGR